jgi:hypothetical protein
MGNDDIVPGLWRFKSSLGMPLESVFDVLVKRNLTPDLADLTKEALSSGVNPVKYESELRYAVMDVYGKDCWERIEPCLRSYCLSLALELTTAK